MSCARVGLLSAAKVALDFLPSFSLSLIGSCAGYTWVCAQTDSVCAKA